MRFLYKLTIKNNLQFILILKYKRQLVFNNELLIVLKNVSLKTT